MKSRFFLISLFLALLVGSPSTKALLVKKMTLRQVTSFSQRIFRGMVLDSSIENDAYESGYLVHYYTLRVEECLKGDCGTGITFKQIVSGDKLPDYQVGKTYLLFLPEESPKTGLLAPVGISQGIYPLESSKGRFLVRGGATGQDYDALKTEVLQYIREEK